MLVCPQCEFENPDSNKFCQQCGVSLTEIACPACGSSVPFGVERCQICGETAGPSWRAIIASVNEAVGWPLVLPALPYLDLQHRYRLLEPLSGGLLSAVGVEVRVLDCEPFRLSPLEMLFSQDPDAPESESEIILRGEAAAKSGKGVIPAIAQTYLALQQELYPSLPHIHDAWEKDGQIVVLLEDRSGLPALAELGATEALPPFQILHLLHQMTELWAVLHPTGHAQSLLELNNLKVDEDQLLYLQRLYNDKPDAAPQLRDLGRVWKLLLQQQPMQESLTPLVQVCEDLEVGTIATVDVLQHCLSMIADALQGDGSSQPDARAIAPADALEAELLTADLSSVLLEDSVNPTLSNLANPALSETTAESGTVPPISETPELAIANSEAVAGELKPTAAESITAEPGKVSPVAAEPVTTKPAITEPVTTKPAITEPVTTEPVTPGVVAVEPVTAEPVTAKSLPPDSTNKSHESQSLPSAASEAESESGPTADPDPLATGAEPSQENLENVLRNEPVSAASRAVDISVSASPTRLELSRGDEDSEGESDDLPTVVLPMKLVGLEDAGRSDIGRQREHNEDYYTIQADVKKLESQNGRSLKARGLYILCDGMGGHAGGEVASSLAASTLKQYFQERWQDGLPNEATIREGILLANKAIYTLNQENASSGSGRMGTTVVLVLIQDTEAAIAHVGDSRIYRYSRRRGLEQLTVDHEVGQREIQRGVEPAIAYGRPDAYQLTQALGPRDEHFVNPDVQFVELTEDLLLLLCSDGLTDNDLLETHTESHLDPMLDGSVSLENGVNHLIDLANHYNGHDNITAIAIHARVRPNLEMMKR
ncbi:MAG: hypothetical protein Fur0046_35970 [Cyanobacteria bacterium J069]|nr:MAG: serine/threonine phosphatase [Cyanobacteria bacterium J069]